MRLNLYMAVARNDIPGGAFSYLHPLRILLTVAAMKSFLKRLALLSGKLRIHLAFFISSDIDTERSVRELLTLQGWREGAEKTSP
jgi:hypothetical protein